MVSDEADDTFYANGGDIVAGDRFTHWIYIDTFSVRVCVLKLKSEKTICPVENGVFQSDFHLITAFIFNPNAKRKFHEPIIFFTDPLHSSIDIRKKNDEEITNGKLFNRGIKVQYAVISKGFSNILLKRKFIYLLSF